MPERTRPIAVKSLTHVDVCCSGEHVEIGLVDHRGEPVTLYLPQDCLNDLLQMLPAMLQEALQRRGAAAGRRGLHPLADWQLTPDANGRAPILSLTAADGVTVSFAMTAAAASGLAEALWRGRELLKPRAEAAAPLRLNH